MSSIRGGGLRPMAALGVVVLAVGGVWLIPKLLEEAGVSGDPWTFEETLPEVKDDFGDEAKVLSISVLGGSVTYEVITDGTVHKRSYIVETGQTRGAQGEPAQSRTRKTENEERPATPGETAAATVTLGDLDEDVVSKMFSELDFSEDGGTAALTGTEWALSSSATPFDRYLADLDGSNIRQTQNKEDVFGGGEPPVPVTPGQPAPQAPQAPDPSKNPQVQSLQKLSECLQAAGTDIAAVQKCQAQAGQ
jgi:hypothetical protein